MQDQKVFEAKHLLEQYQASGENDSGVQTSLGIISKMCDELEQHWESNQVQSL
jgi:hypothetical protein